MPGNKRVLIAGLFHETNTFVEGRTRLKDFQVRRGEEMMAVADDTSPLSGVLECCRRYGWTAVPAMDVRAMPGPVVEDAVIEMFWDGLQEVVISEAEPLDGALLVLHGAMVSESIEDVEGTLLERLRSLPGFRNAPVCGVLDLHANVSGAMAAHADALVAYQENPHTDARQASIRAGSILNNLIGTGARPKTVWKSAGIIWPATNTGTAQEPVLSLERMAREIERVDSDILAINVFPGFAYADVPDAGVSFTAVTLGPEASAANRLERLVEYARQNRGAGNAREISLDEAMRRLKREREGPVLLVEPADNIGAGTSGRGVAVLKALLKHGVRNSAVIIQAPEMVAELAALNPGQKSSITLGSSYDSEPLCINVELISLSDGKFILEDPHSHLASLFGSHIDMGPCAVVDCAGVRILLTSHKTPPFDLAQLRSQGIVPERLFAIGVKAAVAHKRAYDPIAKASYMVETPGPCTGNLPSLAYRRVRRPIYPLDV